MNNNLFTNLYYINIECIIMNTLLYKSVINVGSLVASQEVPVLHTLMTSILNIS